MKLILSRKGFDSSAGGVASPIFPDGAMYSLPISADGARTAYGSIAKGCTAEGTDVGAVVEQLTRGRVRRAELAHFDPDLDAGALPRLPGWRPAFGQTASARRHLDGCGVGVGDVFLFFGWFRQVARDGRGPWAYARTGRDLHVIFGWLQVGEVIPVEAIGVNRVLTKHPWLRDHPHMHFSREDLRKDNVVYVASERLMLPGVGDTGLPGGGEVKRFREELALTDAGSNLRGVWRLPGWFCPERVWDRLTYHRSERAWERVTTGVKLRTVGRGQEFVLDCTTLAAEAGRWVAGRVGSAENSTRKRAG
jgi:hypothetical protein